MKQQKLTRFWRNARMSSAILAIGAHSLFFPKLMPSQESKNQISVFGQNNLVEKRLGGGAGYSFYIDDAKKSPSDVSSFSAGLSLVAEPAIYVDEAFLRFGGEDKRAEYSLTFLRNISQHIPFGIEGSYLFKPLRPLRAGLQVVATGVRGDGTRMQFSFRPVIDGTWKSVNLRLCGIMNWLPGENPLIYDKGFDASLNVDVSSFAVFSQYGILFCQAQKNGSHEVYNYLKFGAIYRF
ncbi:Uncharacterised protein [uncultured archaeon]|nr:Uncharacterised protein [uncultured archaeon]